jgi:hypothetical protein
LCCIVRFIQSLYDVLYIPAEFSRRGEAASLDGNRVNMRAHIDKAQMTTNFEEGSDGQMAGLYGLFGAKHGSDVHH